jgi:hypothetical protein
MKHEKYFKTSNVKRKSILLAFVYFILFELFLSYIFSNFIPFLNILISDILPILFFLYLLLIIFTNPVSVNVDFNSRKFIPILNKKENLVKEFEFEKVKVISLNKSYISGFSLVFMEDFKTNQSYCYTTYKSKNYNLFKREFKLKAKQNFKEYKKYQLEQTKQNSTKISKYANIENKK